MRGACIVLVHGVLRASEGCMYSVGVLSAIEGCMYSVGTWCSKRY